MLERKLYKQNLNKILKTLVKALRIYLDENMLLSKINSLS
jgi:hypothetical protein